MKKKALNKQKLTTFIPFKLTEVYHTEVEYYNADELKRMADNLKTILQEYFGNKSK